MHRRSRAARLAVATIGLSIVTSMLAVIPAFAGDTRLVEIGSTVDCATPRPLDSPGGLVATAVSSGQLTNVDLSTKNCGGQNLNNITLTVGAQAFVNGQPQWDNLAIPFSDGTTVFEVYGTDAKTCKTNGAETLLTCTTKSLRPGQGLDINVVLRAPTSGTGIAVYAAIKVAENTNDNGANEDTFEATVSQDFAAGSSCDAIATFYSPSSRNAETCAVAKGNAQQGKVGLPGDKTTPVTVSEAPTDTTLRLDMCPAATGPKGPIGADIVANIDGDEPTDLVSWTIVVDLKAINRNDVKADNVIVCHWDDNGIPTEVYDVEATKSNKGILTVTFQTLGNGKSRAF